MDEHIPTKQIGSIVFGILSPSMIKKMAAVKIVTPELYDKEGYPVDGGLMDLRMGVIDPGLKCRTCGSKLKECTGHFGYIELARPVVHINFVDIILTLLKCSCHSCGRVLIPKNRIDSFMKVLARVEAEEGPEGRRKKVKEMISELKSINKCPHCKAKQSKLNLEKPSIFMEGDKRLSPIEVRAWLEKIPDDDMSIFGIEAKSFRPEWAVLTVLAIPPVTIRPSITLESGERSEDDLTHKLGDIVRINQRLFENINAGAPEIIIEDLWDLLQYHVITFFNNDVAQLPPARHRNGQPLKTITERLKSKEGRIRHNLAGKRTNFSARTVISPDPMIKINEVGVPEAIAKILTVPERMTEWNREYLKSFITKGPKAYPGANYIIRPDGKKKKITDETKETLLEEVQPGYIVERHIMDGDVALFNRQPSLHRMSMMCHKIKILPYNTFRMNPLVCGPYAADFDGDEMNLHIPQTEEARAEAEMLMDVQTQLISPSHGLSVIGCKQDAISGIYMLTQFLRMSRHEGADLLFKAGVDDTSKLPNKKEVDGKEIFSVLLPDDFDFSGETKTKDPIVIKKGKLIEGFIDNSVMGENSGLLLRSFHKQYGATATVRFLETTFKLSLETLLKHGFTSALSDIDLTDEAQEEIHKLIEKAESDVGDLIKQFRDGHLQILPGKSKEESLEMHINKTLNSARNRAGLMVTKYVNKKSHTLIMVTSGAKGKPLNLAQMMACVGQQNLRGKRIERGFKFRTLSHFKRNDLSPDGRGFIPRGFKSGLKPHEFFFQAMVGRDSLMDTALRTPKSGYLYRRLANALQDVRVEYDGTVRDAAGRVIQFQYGEDAIEVAKSEGGRVNVKRIVGDVLAKEK